MALPYTELKPDLSALKVASKNPTLIWGLWSQSCSVHGVIGIGQSILHADTVTVALRIVPGVTPADSRRCRYF